MDLESKARALSEIEVKTLATISEGKKTIAEISEKTGMPMDSVRRALAWLKEKGMAAIGEGEEILLLNEKGIEAINKGTPEKRLIEALKKLGGKAVLQNALKESEMQANEFNAALGIAKRQSLIVFSEGNVSLTGLEKEWNSKDDYCLEKIKEKTKGKQEIPLKCLENECITTILQRGFGKTKKIEMSQNTIAEITIEGKKALEIALKLKTRSYNIFGEVPPLYIGKKQPYARFLEQVRRKLITMGFKEMETPSIVQEFYNFDVLFQPQNHPARDWASTYQLKQPKFGDLPEKKIVKAVKAAHENGASTGSKGWQYKWSEETAKKLMPAAHGTAHSARQLVKGVQSPSKYFSIARCYRPDTVDRTHLIEFNQLEGIIVGDFSFKHLLGMLKQFAEEIAHAKKVRFMPDYYPFTEPSVQMSAFHPELGWIEFGGAGMFRPEMLEPLGIKHQVLAWGLGIDRLAMFKLGISDVRELFSQKLDWLREEKMAVLD
ncbi:MAG: phenylalanine--tRNA ligase subunit alpha [Candidatus Diapherotrites archaeon]